MTSKMKRGATRSRKNSMKFSRKKIALFLSELDNLSHQHGITIYGKFNLSTYQGDTLLAEDVNAYWHNGGPEVGGYVFYFASDIKPSGGASC